MPVCAIVKDSKVTNLIVASASDPAPELCIFVEIPENLPVMIGHTFRDMLFFDENGNRILPYDQPHPEKVQEVIEEIEVIGEEVIDEEATVVSDEIINLEVIE